MKFEEFIEQVKIFEGFEPVAYYCPAGVLTIGYGRTSGVKKGQRTSKSVESAWLENTLAALYHTVAQKCTNWNYTFNDNQLIALTDFVFNLGIARLNQLTENGQRSVDVIAKKILAYDHANGVRLDGLTKRRTWEYRLFIEPVGKLDYTGSILPDWIRATCDGYGEVVIVDGYNDTLKCRFMNGSESFMSKKMIKLVII